MKKGTIFIIFVFAVLVFTIFYFAIPQVKATTNTKFLSPLAGAASVAAKAIYANPLWKAYVVPFQFLWGLGIMGVFAIIWWWTFGPRKLPTIRKPSISGVKDVGVGTSGITVQTPAGATTRPDAKTELPPEVPLTEETETEEL